MSSFSSNGGAAGGGASHARVAEQTAKARESYITNAKGDKVGNNYVVPKGNFSAFLGYKPPTPGELSGKDQVTGHRILEVALQKELNDLGEGAAKNGNQYRNMFIAQEKFANKHGKTSDAIKDGLDAVRQGPDRNSSEHLEKTKGTKEVQMGSAMSQYLEKVDASRVQAHNDNVRYLEMQYKFQEISKQDQVVSNLMKVRNDAVSRVIRGGGQ